MGIFKNIGGNIPGRNFLDRNFPGGIHQWGVLIGGNFLSGNFSDTSFHVSNLIHLKTETATGGVL